jgi:AraC-like DNA-binding protein
MQSLNGHLDLDSSVAIFGKHNIQRSFGLQEKQYLNESTFSFFKLENILGYKKATFISKLHYWLNKCGRNIEDSEAKWIYNTIKDWAEQLNWSISTLKRIVSSLEEESVIISKKINARKWNHTKWYSIDYNKLNSLLNIDKELMNYSEKKRVNRLAQKEPIIISNNRNNYTHNSSYKEKNSKFERYMKSLIDKKLEEKISDLKIKKADNRKDIDIHSKNKQGLKKIVNGEPEAKTLVLINTSGNIKDTTYQMIELWNKVFESAISPIKAYINKKNQIHLFNILQIYFDNDLKKWREYALKVNSSQFLMGEKETRNNFKAIFSWLIKEETIEKIQNSEYGVGDRELDMNNVSKNIEKKKEEVVNKMDKKISEYIKLNIDETKERKEFEEYVKTHKTEIKDDEYSVLGIIKHISYHSLFKTSEYEVLKESLYESYVMKKYLNITKIEARKKIRKKMKEIIKDKEREERILEILEKKEKEIECLELSQNMTKIGLHSIL